MAITANEMGKRSWEKRNSPKEIERLKEISAKGVEARRKKRQANIDLV